jgi:hypothetical protein
METNNQLNFTDIETPQSGRTLPIQGRPFAMVMEELWNEGYTRVTR